MDKRLIDLLSKITKSDKSTLCMILFVAVSTLALSAGTAYAGVEGCPDPATIHLDLHQLKWLTTKPGWVSDDVVTRTPAGEWSFLNVVLTSSSSDSKPGNDQVRCKYTDGNIDLPSRMFIRFKKDATTVNAQPNTFFAKPAEGFWREMVCPYFCTFTVDYIPANLDGTHVTKSPFGGK